MVWLSLESVNKKEGKNIMEFKRNQKNKKLKGIFVTAFIFSIGVICLTDIIKPSSASVKNVKPRAAEFLEKPADMAGVANAGIRQDVTGDGTEDIITTDISAINSTKLTEEKKAVKIVSGNNKNEIYNLDNTQINSQVHAGWTGLYLCKDDRSQGNNAKDNNNQDKNCLVYWKPVCYQGICCFEWKKFTLDEDGKTEIKDRQKIEFDINHAKETDIKKIKDFYNSFNNIIKNKTIIIADTIPEGEYGYISSEGDGIVYNGEWISGLHASYESLVSDINYFIKNNTEENRPVPQKDIIKNISTGKIQSVQLIANPPGKKTMLSDKEIIQFCRLLDNVVLNEKTGCYSDNTGQWIQFNITFQDGGKSWAAAYNPFFIIDGTGYNTDYKPCEEINVFANKVLQKRSKK